MLRRQHFGYKPLAVTCIILLSKYYQTLYKALLTHMKTCYLLYAKPYTQISDDQPASLNCVIINDQNFNPSSMSCTA